MKRFIQISIYFTSIIIILCLIIIYFCYNLNKYLFDFVHNCDTYNNEDEMVKNLKNIHYPTNFTNLEIYEYMYLLMIDLYNKANEGTLDMTKLIDKNDIILKENIFYCNKVLCSVYEDKNNNIWIIIRGTASHDEIKNDMEISQKKYSTDVKYNKIKCHTGFLKIYNNIKPELMKILNNKKKINNIYCYGHSLGGSVISLLSLDLYDFLKNKSESLIIFTSGAPRTCNVEFKNLIEKREIKLYHLENSSDFMLHISLPLIIYGNKIYNYEYSGKRVIFTDNNNCVAINHSITTYFNNRYKFNMN